MQRRIIILGATGSIGTQALDLVRANRDKFKVVGLTTNNQIDIIKIVLDKNVRLDVLDIDGRTILYYPIKFDYIDVIKLLLNKSKYIIGTPLLKIQDNNYNNALHYCVIFNRIKILENK